MGQNQNVRNSSDNETRVTRIHNDNKDDSLLKFVKMLSNN